MKNEYGIKCFTISKKIKDYYVTRNNNLLYLGPFETIQEAEKAKFECIKSEKESENDT